jgi:hypothetical protein
MIVLERLRALNLHTINLPLSTPSTDPHVPILASASLSKSLHVIVLFYEHSQDLGIFAQRIIGGKGGINAGSAVNFVRYIQAVLPSTGIILANLGQLRWWRRGGKAVTHTTWFALPRKSAVSETPRFDPIKNSVRGNRNTEEHVSYIFNHVITELCDPKARISVIGVGDGSYQASNFLDRNWSAWGERMESFSMICPMQQQSDIEDAQFRDWLLKVSKLVLIACTHCTC